MPKKQLGPLHRICVPFAVCLCDLCVRLGWGLGMASSVSLMGHTRHRKRPHHGTDRIHGDNRLVHRTWLGILHNRSMIGNPPRTWHIRSPMDRLLHPNTKRDLDCPQRIGHNFQRAVSARWWGKPVRGQGWHPRRCSVLRRRRHPYDHSNRRHTYTAKRKKK